MGYIHGLHEYASRNWLELQVVDFIPRANLTCLLRLSVDGISKKPGGIFYPFEQILVPVQMEMSTPPQRFVQGACCLNLNFLGGIVWRINTLILCFVVKDKQSDWHGCCFLVGTLDSSVQPRAHKHLQKRRQSRSNPSLANGDVPWWPVFHRLRSMQCFTSLQLSLVAWLPRVDLFYVTCSDTRCRFKSATKHRTSYLMGKPGTHACLINLQWNSVVWALSPWPLSLLINGFHPKTTFYHYSRNHC